MQGGAEDACRWGRVMANRWRGVRPCVIGRRAGVAAGSRDLWMEGTGAGWPCVFIRRAGAAVGGRDLRMEVAGFVDGERRSPSPDSRCGGASMECGWAVRAVAAGGSCAGVGEWRVDGACVGGGCADCRASAEGHCFVSSFNFFFSYGAQHTTLGKSETLIRVL